MPKTFDVEQLISDTVSKTVFELKKANLMRDNKKTAFQKTEQLLYNYNDFKKAVNDKYEKIEQIEMYGVPQKSKSIIPMPDGTVTGERKTDAEKEREKIAEIEMTIETTVKFISIIDEALDRIRGDRYFDIIPMKYFEDVGRADIAAHFECDERTVTRNKSRLVNKLKISLFSDDSIKELLM